VTSPALTRRPEVPASRTGYCYPSPKRLRISRASLTAPPQSKKQVSLSPDSASLSLSLPAPQQHSAKHPTSSARTDAASPTFQIASEPPCAAGRTTPQARQPARHAHPTPPTPPQRPGRVREIHRTRQAQRTHQAARPLPRQDAPQAMPSQRQPNVRQRPTVRHALMSRGRTKPSPTRTPRHQPGLDDSSPKQSLTISNVEQWHAEQARTHKTLDVNSTPSAHARRPQETRSSST